MESLKPNDYKEYKDVLFQLSHFEWNGEYTNVSNRIIRVLKINGKIIGAGSLFILNKLHCNPFGQIEDVVVSEDYRRNGYGKLIIDDLITIAKDHKCYKIVLNSLKHNEEFYKSCGFDCVASQFKYDYTFHEKNSQ
jgi:GNAT superfamily N-acetyltransferase